MAIFPGDSPVLVPNSALKDIDDASVDDTTITKLDNKPGREYIEPIIIGCAAYKFQYSTVTHHTWFSYRLYRKPTPYDGGFYVSSPTPPNRIAVAYIEIGKDVPAEDVVLMKILETGNGAD